MGTEVEALVTLEEYLDKAYSPDREFRDGVLAERIVGEKKHALLQALLTIYIGNRRKEWNIRVYTELRVKIREGWYPIPDICLYAPPDFEGRYPDRPPLLWIEILSPDDRMVDVWSKADELTALGVPYVWIIDPATLESELRTAAGLAAVPDKTLRLPDSPVVIPLRDVVAE